MYEAHEHCSALDRLVIVAFDFDGMQLSHTRGRTATAHTDRNLGSTDGYTRAADRDSDSTDHNTKPGPADRDADASTDNRADEHRDGYSDAGSTHQYAAAPSAHSGFCANRTQVRDGSRSDESHEWLRL